MSVRQPDQNVSDFLTVTVNVAGDPSQDVVSAPSAVLEAVLVVAVPLIEISDG